MSFHAEVSYHRERWRGGEIIGRNESRCRSCLSSRLENSVPVKSVSLNVRGDVSCTTNCDRKCRESLTDLRFDEKKPDECTPLKLLFLSLSFEIHQAFHEGRFDTFVSIGKIIFEKYAWLFELILIRGRKLYRPQ